MKKHVIIIGAGRFGREISGWIRDAIDDGADWELKGFLDDRSRVLEGKKSDLPILGSATTYRIQSEDVFVVAIGDPDQKKKYCAPILDGRGEFLTVIHPLATVCRNVEVGTGVFLAPFASLTSDLRIGNFVCIGPHSNVAHDAEVGDWSQINTHCGVNGNVRIGEGVFLGGHACITPDVKIGNGAYIGAGSVVIRDVPQGAKMFGNPARPLPQAKTVAERGRI